MSMPKTADYAFTGGWPAPKTVQRAYDEADLTRGQAYRVFYPTVSIMATWKGNLKGDCVPNAVFALLEGTPHDVERERAAVMARD